MNEQFLEKWAKLLVDYCIEVKPKDIVRISGSNAALALIKKLNIEVARRGAFPLIRIRSSELTSDYYRHATKEQLSHVTKIELYETRHITSEISIRSEDKALTFADVDPQKQAIVSAARKILNQITLSNIRWVLTLYPTETYALNSNLSVEKFEDFVAKVMFLDKNDPAECWRKLSKIQERIIRKLETAQTVRIIAENTDISFSISGRKFINSDGKQNMPSGEIYTSPIENSMEGHLAVSFPVCRYGREIEGIKLEFRKGKVVSASATKNEEFLLQMLDSDRGARYVGEFGIGMNNTIRTFTKNILFDEKIGGTVHIAIGNSYPKTGGQNRSGLHWDMIVDLRKGGELYLDEKLFQKNGEMLSEGLPLNLNI